MNGDLVARVRKVLRDHVERRSSGRRLSEQIGDAPNYVGRVLRGEITLRLDRLDAMLQALGVPRRVFFEQVLGAGDLDLSALLALLAPPERKVPRALRPVDHLLRELDSRALEAETDIETDLGADAESRDAESPDAAPSDAAPSDGLRKRLEELEGLRLEDRQAARRQTESALAELVTQRTTQAVCAELAELLGVWAAIARVEGRRADAGAALRRADRLAVLARRPRTRGAVDQKAAYLLRDLDEGRLALRVLERAGDAFLRAGDHTACGRSLVDRAVVHVHLGELGDAAELYEASLRWLPAEEWRNRVSALQGLAYCQRELGSSARARATLAQARTEHGERTSLLLAWVLWAEADLFAEDASFDAALAAMASAGELFEHYGDTMNHALATLARAEVLLRAGRLGELSGVADELLRQLESWRGDRIADAALWELLRLVRRGELTLEVLDATRRALHESAAARRP